MSNERPAPDSRLEQWYGSSGHRLGAQERIPDRSEGKHNSATGLRIAIQGEAGSFSHEAAMKLSPGATIVSQSLSAEAFGALSSGEVDAAVIPIENSLAGSVLEHFDLLLKHDVKVEREALLRIRHNLIGMKGARIDEIDRAFSHPVALAQCKKFLAAHPRMKPLAFYDTAGSVKQLVELGDRHAGAIASAGAAKYYGAEILEAGIEDSTENFTRFFFVRRAADAVTDPESNKISLAFSVENRPGSLVRALEELSGLGTNLTKIESRPVLGKPWDYIFYVDCQLGSAEEGSRAADALGRQCVMVKELGRYREAER